MGVMYENWPGEIQASLFADWPSPGVWRRSKQALFTSVICTYSLIWDLGG